MADVLLTGTFTRLDGTPAVGTVIIQPSRSPILDLEGKQVISGPQRFTLDAGGRFSVNLPPTDDPALGANFTYDVMVAMHHANWQVFGLTLPVDMVSVDVLDPPAGVVKEYPTRAEWDALTEAAVAEMESALTGAESARDTTVDARDTTVVARDETITARDVTLTARDTAVGAASEAETARTETLTARDATFTARDVTVEARDATFTARTETTTAVGEAEAARDTAVGAAGDAETARDVAVGAAGDAETARTSAWEAVDTPGRQGPPGEVTTAALTAALAGKVTGTGLALRHDTTVGERVMLDHPGGTTMLSGDTGWRTVPATSAQIPGLTSIYIRRTTHHIHVSIFANAAFTPGEVETIAILPQGFRASTTAVRGRVPFDVMNAYNHDAARPSHTVTLRENGEIRLRLEGTTRLHAVLTIWAQPDWPTSLPGLPV